MHLCFMHRHTRTHTHAGVFTTNKRGYPVLSKAHQELLALAFRHSIQVHGLAAQRCMAAQQLCC